MKKKLTIWISLVSLLCGLSISFLHAAPPQPRPSEHPEYRAAMDNLRDARKHLEKALNDGYGHRERAMRAIDHALEECRQAVEVLH